MRERGGPGLGTLSAVPTGPQPTAQVLQRWGLLSELDGIEAKALGLFSPTSRGH